jgi:uncharacterized repeat protein (TIGR03803 family)
MKTNLIFSLLLLTTVTFAQVSHTKNVLRTIGSGAKHEILSYEKSMFTAQGITKLFDFDIQNPYSLLYRSNLVNDGTYIYGIVANLAYDNCFLIRVKPDVTDFKELYSFDDTFISCEISISENKIYARINNTSIFNINTDGSNYSEIDITAQMNEKEFIGSLVVSENIVYGIILTYLGDGKGTRIFKINADGTGFSIVYSSDGISDLYMAEKTLIGNKNGEIFRINKDGSGYFEYRISSVLEIISKGSVIYGITYNNIGDGWNIFKVNLDGSAFKILKSISSSEPTFMKSLSISDNTLFGISENYEILKINLDGTNFKQIPTDFMGSDSYYEPTLIGKSLCGFVSEDFSNGVFFNFNTTDNSYTTVFKFATSDSGIMPIGSLIESNGKLFGNTYVGGTYGMGTIFSIDKDGNGFTKLFEFNGIETGGWPIGQLTLLGNTLFGATSGGFGQSENGTIFKINIDGTGFTKIHNFDGTNGLTPNGSLVFYKEKLYGNTNDGGSDYHGVMFRINPDGTGFTNILDYTSKGTGERSENGIIISDDVIYGVSSIDYGSLFSVNIDGTGLRKIFEMNDVSGNFSYCKRLLIKDELYITTSEGGENGVGTIFKIKTDGTGFQVLYNFEGFDDSPVGSGFRNNSLMFHNGVLYGTATGNGINDHGYLYSINLDGTEFTKLSDFYGEYGSMPYLCDLIIDDNEDIFGMTTFGGKYSGGIIYKYSVGEPSTSIPEINENSQVQVFPNPTKGKLQLRFKKVPESETWITVFNFSGKTVLKTKVYNKEENIDISGNKSGLYFIKVNQGVSNKTFKIILE